MNKCIYTNIKTNKKCKRNAVNNGYCKFHNAKQFNLEDLPDLIVSTIVEKCSNDIKSLLNLYRVSKKFNELTILPLYKLYQTLNISLYHEKCMNEYNLSIYNRFMLQTYKKCNKCNNSKSRIYYPFPVRLCQQCFNIVTINSIDLFPKYSIVHHTKPYHYYKSRQGAIYYLIKDLEKNYNSKLEDLHLNDYKKNISVQLNIPTSDLTKHSHTYVHCIMPLINIVEREYYRKIAETTISKWIKKKNITVLTNKTIKKLLDSIKTINNKEKYENIFNNLENIYEQYKLEEFYIRYNIMINELQNIINSHPYFNCINIKEIPELSTLIDPLKLKSLCVNSFLKEQYRIKNLLNKFINERINIIINDFDDNLANKIAQSILKYPHKSIYEYNPGEFINEFNKIFYGIEVMCQHITWNKVKDYINKIHTSNVCNICNQAFSNVDLCIKHKFNIHNFQKYY